MLANKLNYGDTIGVTCKIDTDNNKIEILDEFLK